MGAMKTFVQTPTSLVVSAPTTIWFLLKIIPLDIEKCIFVQAGANPRAFNLIANIFEELMATAPS